MANTKQPAAAKPEGRIKQVPGSIVASGDQQKFVWIICAVLALTTLAIFWPITHHEFVNFDDTDFVTQNPHVQAGITWEGIKWAFSPHTEVARNWHPLTMLTHMLDCQLFGLNAGMHHLVTLLYHIANTLLLFLVLRKMTGALWRSAIVAMLFAIHPLHVESVAWMAERKDVLSTLFWLLVMWAYTNYSRTFAIRNYVLALVFLALGLLSKPMLVTMPFVLLLMDYWPLKRFSLTNSQKQNTIPNKKNPPPIDQSSDRPELFWRASPNVGIRILQLFAEKIPFFMLVSPMIWMTFYIQKTGGAMLSTNDLTLSTRIGNALVSYCKYIIKMFWPDNLAGLYLRHGDWPIGLVALAALFLIAMCVIAVVLAKRKPYFTFGWFYYLGTLVPVIGVVQVGMQAMADRFTYVPMTGLFIALVWGLWDFAQRTGTRREALVIVAVASFIACAAVTRHVLPFWTNSETLFNRMIAVDPNNFMAHYNLANQYNRKGNKEAAIEQFQLALKAEPNYAEAHNNLAGVYQDQRRFDEAIAEYAQAAHIYSNTTYVVNLANAYVNAGRYAEALPIYEEAQHLDPKSTDARANAALAQVAWGNQLATSNRVADAEQHFRAALQANPNNADALADLGLCLTREGDLQEGGQRLLDAEKMRGKPTTSDPVAFAQLAWANYLSAKNSLKEAITHYEAAAKLEPSNPDIYNGLGVCYGMLGDMPDAAKQFEQVLRLNPNDSAAHGNLGNALAAQNKIDEAIPHYLAALKNNSNDFQAHFNLALSLSRIGRKAEAIDHYKQAIQINPNYVEAKKALADLEK